MKTIKEKPLLMCAEMVRAVLAGQKTQTRRIVKPQPDSDNAPQWHNHGEGAHKKHCPYGQPGDRIWVKETHYRWGKWVKNGISKKTGRQKWRGKFRSDAIGLERDGGLVPAKSRTEVGWHKRPSIFMPKWFRHRITLEIVSVRVERVQEISGGAVLAEGACPPQIVGGERAALLKDYWIPLWDSLNAKRDEGKYAWAKNPWVWVIEFKKL